MCEICWRSADFSCTNRSNSLYGHTTSRPVRFIVLQNCKDDDNACNAIDSCTILFVIQMFPLFAFLRCMHVGACSWRVRVFLCGSSSRFLACSYLLGARIAIHLPNHPSESSPSFWVKRLTWLDQMLETRNSASTEVTLRSCRRK